MMMNVHLLIMIGGDCFNQFSHDDYIYFLKSISRDIVIEGDIYNDDITIKNLIPCSYVIDEFLMYVSKSEITCGVETIDELVEYFDDYNDGEYMEEDSYFNYSFEDIANAPYYEYFYYNMPEAAKKRFFEKPFGKEYCDLTELELAIYDIVKRKLQD